jgi:hypothetical protein
MSSFSLVTTMRPSGSLTDDFHLCATAVIDGPDPHLHDIFNTCTELMVSQDSEDAALRKTIPALELSVSQVAVSNPGAYLTQKQAATVLRITITTGASLWFIYDETTLVTMVFTGPGDVLVLCQGCLFESYSIEPIVTGIEHLSPPDFVLPMDQMATGIPKHGRSQSGRSTLLFDGDQRGPRGLHRRPHRDAHAVQAR